MKMKRCSKCQRVLPVGEFNRHTSTRDGLRPDCKACVSKYKKDYYAANIDRIRKRRREHYVANADRIRERSREYYVSNTPACSERRRQYYQDHHEEIRRYFRRYRQDNPSKVKAQNVVNSLVRNGTITRPDTCSACGGGGRIEAHHDDYSKPLDIQWLCRSCHRRHHVNQIRTNHKQEAV